MQSSSNAALPLFSAIYGDLTESHGAEKSTSCLVDFRVKISLPQASEMVSKALKVGYEATLPGSFQRLILTGSSLKTVVTSQEKDSNASFLILPRSGMMRNGNIYMRPHLQCLTSESDFSLLPTPTRQDGPSFYVVTLRQSLERFNKRGRGKRDVNLQQALIRYYNFPKAFANPRFSEWMMGFTKDHTLCPDWPHVATQSAP